MTDHDPRLGYATPRCMVRGVDGRLHGPLPWWRAYALMRALPCDGPRGADLVVLADDAPTVVSVAAAQTGFDW
jgi:hypothetical protein